MSDPTRTAPRSGGADEDGPSMANEVTVSISIGDYLDRLTILERKAERGGSDQARRAAAAKLATWKRLLQTASIDWAQVGSLVEALRSVNGRLWDREDAIRRHLARSEPAGVAEVAADIVRLNDERAAIKAALDLHTGATWSDAKYYDVAPTSSTR